MSNPNRGKLKWASDCESEEACEPYIEERIQALEEAVRKIIASLNKGGHESR